MKQISRRKFVKGSLWLGGATALLGVEGTRILTGIAQGADNETLGKNSYILSRPESVIYSACLQCNTQCTIKTKIQDGILVKIDGNPYSPVNMQPQVSYALGLGDSARIDGHVCPKGQGGVQTQYDPYRIRKVLKRNGPRGSNKWKAIPFEQAIAEISEGGKLFADIGENRVVPGFRDVFVLRDARAAKEMAEDVKAIRAKNMTVAEFKTKHAANLDALIDPDHPDLGPKNNQFVFQAGRIEPGRSDFAKRFVNGALGSLNWYAHTTICEQAHHVAYKYTTAQWNGKGWAMGSAHMKPDFGNAEFVIFWGTGAFEANFGPTPMGPQVAQGIVDRGMKIAVIDPRLSKTAAKGWWIPVRPGGGGDNALAMAMIRWIIENQRYDARFLANANKAAAKAGGELSWTSASWLVNPETGAFLRAADVGAGPAEQFVVSLGGKAVAVDPNDDKKPVVGDLDVEVKLGEVTAKSSFRLLKEEAMRYDLDFYAKTAGVEKATIAALAQEFTSHGKRAAIDFYRGPIKHTNGYYTAQAIISLNILIGSADWKGGLTPGGGAYDAMGGKPGQPFNLGALHPGKLNAFGVKNTRESSGSYEESTLFSGYPAKRPWFPFTDDVYQEIVPAAYAGYPYPVKILWLHKGTPVLASPAGHLQIKMLQDTEKIPLFIADDIVVAETSMYADYLFPDLTYLERWAFLGATPVTYVKTMKFRQPAAAPIPDVVDVAGEKMPISMEAVMIGVASRLGLPGFGRNGFASGTDLTRPEDYYLKAAANLAWGEKEGQAVPDADDAEMATFRKARRHLPAAVYDEAKWQQAVGPLWRKTVYVLNRGGRFEDPKAAYSGDFMAHPWAKQFNLYVEPVAKAHQSVTGDRLSGVAHFEPLRHLDGAPVDITSRDLDLFTFKEIFGGQSRTVSNYAAQLALLPENFVLMSKEDAKQLGLHEGDLVRITSDGFDGGFDLGNGQKSFVEGKVKPIAGMRPGAVAASWSYGHWAYGARDVVIDGELIKGEAKRGKGLVPNPAMGVDHYLKDIAMIDPIAGDAVFSGTRVKLVKVADAR
ncbi:MAG: molybdopterin-dependent oxidoreductase [Symbiobacteriia bacterium]